MLYDLLSSLGRRFLLGDLRLATFISPWAMSFNRETYEVHVHRMWERSLQKIPIEVCCAGYAPQPISTEFTFALSPTPEVLPSLPQQPRMRLKVRRKARSRARRRQQSDRTTTMTRSRGSASPRQMTSGAAEADLSLFPSALELCYFG